MPGTFPRLRFALRGLYSLLLVLLSFAFGGPVAMDAPPWSWSAPLEGLDLQPAHATRYRPGAVEVPVGVLSRRWYHHATGVAAV